MSNHVYFSDFEVDLDSGEVRRQGVRVRLRGKPCQILIALLKDAGEVVTRRQLIESLWPADTFVDFESNLKTALSTLRRILGDSADFPRFVETIQGVGYRFVHPVSRISPAPAASVSAPEATAASTLAPTSSRMSAEAAPELLSVPGANLRERQWKWVAAGAGVLVIAAVFVFVALRSRQAATSSHDRSSRVMMVLPFENLSTDDPSTELLTDGITRQMTTALQDHLSGKFAVVAQDSALQYKHSHKSLDDISKELGGVDYVVEGTVRRSNNSVHIDAELLRVSDHKRVWTGTFQTSLAEVESSQRDIATHILESLSIEVMQTLSPELRTNGIPGQHSRNGTAGW